MRILFLNSWQGKTGKVFFDFLLSQTPDTDVFCLMETSPELNSKLSEVFVGYKRVYGSGGKYIDGNEYGQSTFVKAGIKVVSTNVSKIKKNWIGVILNCVLEINSRKISIVNIHGISQPGDKLDNKDRINQSKTILESLKNIDLPTIIGGDFNLLPVTESIKMFVDAGYKNLIRDFNIKSTRNRLSWEQFKDDPNHS